MNALKLLANQQEDGDGLIQNIVTNLCERKGFMEGLREFMQIDNHLALKEDTCGKAWAPLKYEGREDQKDTQR